MNLNAFRLIFYKIDKKEVIIMKRKCLGYLVAVLFCCLFAMMTVNAADERLGTVVDGSLLTEGTEAEGFTERIARGTYLSYGIGRLSK